MHEGDKGVRVDCVGGLVNTSEFIMVRRLAECLGLVIPHFQTDALPLLFFLPPSHFKIFSSIVNVNCFERNKSASISGVDILLL